MCHHCNYISSPRCLSVSSQLSWTLKMLLTENILRFDKFYSSSKRRSETIRISGPVFCAAVDNFGAMAPEIRLLPARSDIHPPLLRQKICHRKYCLEITSVKSDFIKSATYPCLQRRAFMHQTYWSAPLLNAGWAAIPFQERKQFSIQSKAFSHALQHNRVWTRGK